MNILNLLGAVLVILKLLNVIHLSWWLVLLPFAPTAFGMLLMIAVIVLAALGSA